MKLQDCFISGWETGGELNAIISIKVLDKSKVFQIKAGIEAEMTTPTISGKIEAEANIDKSTLNKETETTIAVNWSGGGSIKDPTEDWNIDSLKKAAAAFPDLVAITPQRTYAILTKYTALASFHQQQRNFSPLDYENAGIYTGSLLDNYMDYKALWKQISNATYELQVNRATIDMGEPTEEIWELAKVHEFHGPDQGRSQSENSDVDREAKRLKAPSPALNGYEMIESSRGSHVVKATAQHSYLQDPVGSFFTQFDGFRPSFAGLIAARKVCRSEMSKIVREVDLVAKDPTLALDADRDMYFLNPLVFRQLLPVRRLNLDAWTNADLSLRLFARSLLKTHCLELETLQLHCYLATVLPKSGTATFRQYTTWTLTSRRMRFVCKGLSKELPTKHATIPSKVAQVLPQTRISTRGQCCSMILKSLIKRTDHPS